jgi:hypothetical protein
LVGISFHSFTHTAVVHFESTRRGVARQAAADLLEGGLESGFVHA